MNRRMGAGDAVRVGGKGRAAAVAAAMALAALVAGCGGPDAAALVGNARSALAKKDTEAARINLNYTTVSAPISGRIGRSLVTEIGRAHV